MGPIQVVVTDANNLTLEVTPTAETSIVLDRGVAGPTGMVWEGNWSSATYYSVNDAVYYAAGNASYICILGNTNQVPTNATYWELLVSGAGNVTGAASSTDNAVVRFDGTTGKLIQNSLMTIADDGTTVVNSSSSTNAFRVTHTGTGNAFLVEDAATIDSTPFVIDAGGRVSIGSTAAVTYSTVSSVNPALQVNAAGSTAIGLSRFSANNSGNNFWFLKSRGTTIGAFDPVVNGDTLGGIGWFGADGTSGIFAATISAVVDGTPGQTAGTFTIGLSYNILTIGTTDFTLIGAASNTVGLTFTATGAGTGTGTATLTTGDMPSRLVFSTTPDGSGTPVEAMRIGSTGAIGFNSITTLGGSSGRFRFGGNITGNTGSTGVLYTPTIQSDVTTSATVFVSQPSTVDAAFTLGTLSHFLAAQSTITGGSRTAPTNQVGFQVNSSLTGATNNFGYRGEIAAGTGRWNLYMSGTADNYLAGSLGIGVVSPTAPLDVNGSILSRASGGEGGQISFNNPDNASIGFSIDVASADTARIFQTRNNSVMNIGQLTGTGGIVTFSTAAAERMRIDASGNVGIGTNTPDSKLDVVGDITLSTSSSKIVGDSVTFQANTANAGTTVQVSPNGTGNFSALDVKNGSGFHFTRFSFGVQSSGTGYISGDFSGSSFYGPFHLTLAGGTGGMYWDIDGNAGLGTTSPTTLSNLRGLSINATSGGFVEFLAASTSVGKVLTDANGLQVTSVAAKPIILKTNDTDRVTIDSAGSTYIETGNLWQYAPTPTSKAAVATLTAAELFTGILNTTGTTYTVTVPTGTNIDAFYPQVPAVNIGFDFYIINTATGTITIAVNTGVTALGALTIPTATSAMFRFRRTAANTYVMYRLR